MQYRLGIDLGGTSVKMGLVNPKNKIIDMVSVPSSGIKNPTQLIKNIGLAGKKLVRGKRIQSMGVGVAGDIDSQRGIVRVSPNLGWKNVPLKKTLKKFLKGSIVVDNDANVAAWGIYKTQISQKVQHVLVLTLGTGVGGGLILNGQVHRGATGSAGEVGHMIMVENGRPCNCGQKGCLEAYAGGSYIVRHVKSELRAGKRSSLRPIYKQNAKNITSLSIAKAANTGDRYAKSIWKEAGTILGRAIGDLTYVFNPEKIVLTGGVAQAKNLILTPLKKELRNRPFITPVQTLSVQIAQQASHIGVVGAALLRE